MFIVTEYAALSDSFAFRSNNSNREINDFETKFVIFFNKILEFSKDISYVNCSSN